MRTSKPARYVEKGSARTGPCGAAAFTPARTNCCFCASRRARFEVPFAVIEHYLEEPLGDREIRPEHRNGRTARYDRGLVPVPNALEIAVRGARIRFTRSIPAGCSFIGQRVVNAIGTLRLVLIGYGVPFPPHNSDK